MVRKKLYWRIQNKVKMVDNLRLAFAFKYLDILRYKKKITEKDVNSLTLIILKYLDRQSSSVIYVIRLSRPDFTRPGSDVIVLCLHSAN